MWQPIETAPSGVEKMLFYSPTVRLNLATMRKEPVGVVLGGTFVDGEIHLERSHGGGAVPWEITHWMPLPEPPQP